MAPPARHGPELTPAAAMPGPEDYLSAHPFMVVTLVLVQIGTTLALVHVLAGPRDATGARSPPSTTSAVDVPRNGTTA